jgi:hypothetical protein
MSIREILQYESLENLLAEEGFAASSNGKRLKLLEFFLKNGFIDETYLEHI